MTPRPDANTTAIEANAIDAFLAFARTYLTSTERLTDNVPSPAPSAPDERVAAPPRALNRSMLKRTLTYTRDTTCEIVSRAHREAAELVARQIFCRAFH
jgi:hypothetical protein